MEYSFGSQHCTRRVQIASSVPFNQNALKCIITTLSNPCSFRFNAEARDVFSVSASRWWTRRCDARGSLDRASSYIIVGTPARLVEIHGVQLAVQIRVSSIVTPSCSSISIILAATLGKENESRRRLERDGIERRIEREGRTFEGRRLGRNVHRAAHKLVARV